MIRVAISLQRIIVSALILTSIVGVLNLTASQPAYAATFTIDSTGGDCNTIGVWDASKRQCTLKFNVLGSIVIAADGITLDGAKHTLTGDGTGNGVLVDGRTGVTIKNVVVENFNVGIFLDESNGNTLAGNLANSNSFTGIVLSDSDGNTLINNVANSNGQVGISVGGGSNGNTLTKNTANLNTLRGILVGSSGNTLIGNVANSNVLTGIFVESASGNTLTKNTANLNGEDGFHLEGTNTIKGNTANSNGTFGYEATGSIGLIFSKNRCSGNGSGGSDPSGLCLPQP